MISISPYSLIQKQKNWIEDTFKKINIKETILTDLKNPTLWPEIGVIFGIGSGIGQQFAHNPFMCSAMKENSILKAINLSKQIEIKTFAAFTPVALATSYIGYKLLARDQKDGKTLSVKEQFSHEIALLPWKNITTAGLLMGSLMGANVLFQLTLQDFDPSGHVMLTSAATYGTAVILEYLKNAQANKIAIGAAAVTAIANMIFMTNTTACYHTVAEVVAGAFTATAAREIVNRFPLESYAKRAIETYNRLIPQIVPQPF